MESNKVEVEIEIERRGQFNAWYRQGVVSWSERTVANEICIVKTTPQTTLMMDDDG